MNGHSVKTEEGMGEEKNGTRLNGALQPDFIMHQKRENEGDVQQGQK